MDVSIFKILESVTKPVLDNNLTKLLGDDALRRHPSGITPIPSTGWRNSYLIDPRLKYIVPLYSFGMSTGVFSL
jgi:hypothetical protein